MLSTLRGRLNQTGTGGRLLTLALDHAVLTGVNRDEAKLLHPGTLSSQFHGPRSCEPSKADKGKYEAHCPLDTSPAAGCAASPRGVAWNMARSRRAMPRPQWSSIAKGAMCLVRHTKWVSPSPCLPTSQKFYFSSSSFAGQCSLGITISFV